MSTASRTERSAPPGGPPELTVVVPTRDEAEAVGPLCRDLARHLDGLAWEALFVDDSDDGTADRLRRLAEADPRIRVHHRESGRGLGSAITTGLQLSRGRYVAVIDADGQHPPRLLTRMLDRARAGAGVVVASRFAPGGSLGDLPAARRRVARFARGAARFLVPAARATSDPLSGCFLVRRETVAGRRLRPASWKVLLEVLAAAGPVPVADVAYRFRRRRNGQSKLGAREVAAFGLHALSLAWRGRDRRPLAVGLQYTLAVRLGLLAVTLLTLGMPHSGHLLPPAGPERVWRLWAEWDGFWYERIAWLGYAGGRAYAFFPLYPLLLRATAGLTGMSLAQSGVLVSALASVACFALLYDQVARDHGPATAERAVRYLALFPTGFYLAAAYSEATFLALALLTMRALRQRSWTLAAVAGCAAALTRNVGVALALPAAWVWLRERGLRPSLAVAGAPAGLAVYMLFCALTRGDPLAFLHAESFWSRHLAWPWTAAADALQASLIGGPYAARNALDLAAVVAAALALSAGRRWLHPTERLFAWAVLAMTVAAPLPVGRGEVLLSSTRLVLAAYPAFIVLARLGRRPAVDRFVTTVFPLAQAAAFILFTHSYFVA